MSNDLLRMLPFKAYLSCPTEPYERAMPFWPALPPSLFLSSLVSVFAGGSWGGAGTEAGTAGWAGDERVVPMVEIQRNKTTEG